MAGLSDILETTRFEKLAEGFVFTEGPLWHPDGFYYFVDVRSSMLYRIVPGQRHEVVRKTTGGNGTTFDMQGRLINCEGDGRRLTRTEADGTVTVLIDRHEGKRLNRPNDVICRSDGTLFFTDPALRVPVAERDVGEGAVYRITARRQQPFRRMVRVSQRPRVVARRADPVRGEHTLDRLHPRHRTGRGGRHGEAARVCRHVVRREARACPTA